MSDPNRVRSTSGVSFQEPETVKLRSSSQSQNQPPASNNRASGAYGNRNDRSSRVFSNLQETMNQIKQEEVEQQSNQSSAAKKSGGTVGKKSKGTLKTMGFQFSKNKTPVMANTFVPPQNQVSQAILDKWKLPGYPESGVTINESFLKGLGVGFVPLGADAKDWVGEFLQTLFEKLEENSERNPLLPKANRNLLKNVIEECNFLLENQAKLEKVIKVQSLIRGYLVRKKLKNWKGDQQGFNYTQNAMFECINGFRDLFQLEKNYITSLKRIVDIYLGPLKKAITSKSSSSLSTLSNLLAHGGTDVLISKDDMTSIFGNVEDILRVHMKICQHFEGLYNKWPFINNVGETFLKFAPQLTVYGPFVSNSKNSLDTLFRCQQQQPKFKQWLEDTAIQTGEDLMGLLVKPLNYINQYQLLLKLWTKKLPPMHRDMANLRNAYVAIKRTNKFIQENYQESTNRAKILDIQRRLGNTIELNQPKRAFLSEGEISTLERSLVLTSEKLRHYFLFKDLILFCQEDSNKNFKLLNTFTFKETTLTDDTQGNQFILTLAVAGNANSAVKLLFKTREEKVKFGSKVKELIDNTKVSRVFAVPLPKLLEREKSHDGIPFVVKCTVEHIKKHKEMEGIFRLSGSTTEVNELKQFFNDFEEIPKVLPDLSKFNVYSVCAILKMFFRELPEPLMTYQAYKPATQINVEDGRDVCVEAIKAIVASLPEQNFKLLKYLMTFLNGVAQLCNKNKMTAANLAIVFGPNLLFPAEESIESILNIPKLNIVFQIMLENYAEVFPSA